jgi:hypothetical protein
MSWEQTLLRKSITEEETVAAVEILTRNPNMGGFSGDLTFTDILLINEVLVNESKRSKGGSSDELLVLSKDLDDITNALEDKLGEIKIYFVEKEIDGKRWQVELMRRKRMGRERNSRRMDDLE